MRYFGNRSGPAIAGSVGAAWLMGLQYSRPIFKGFTSFILTVGAFLFVAMLTGHAIAWAGLAVKIAFFSTLVLTFFVGFVPKGRVYTALSWLWLALIVAFVFFFIAWLFGLGHH